MSIIGVISVILAAAGGIYSLSFLGKKAAEEFYVEDVTLLNIPTTGAAGYSGYPTFAISSVVQDSSVTIFPTNFPPNDTFWVRMNWMHTKGVAGTIVQTVTTDANGNLSGTTFSIPSFLEGSYQIAIRLESPISGYYSFNWFYNNTAPGPKITATPTMTPPMTVTPRASATPTVKVTQSNLTATLSPTPTRENTLTPNPTKTQTSTPKPSATSTQKLQSDTPTSTITSTVEEPSPQRGGGLNPVPPLPDDLVFKVEWPNKMLVNQPDTIHVSIYPAEESRKEDAIVEGHDIAIATPKSIIWDGDTEMRFLSDFHIYYKANLTCDNKAVTISSNDTEFLFKQPEIVCDWIINISEAGSQPIIASVEVYWYPLGQNENVQQKEVFREIISTSVKKPFLEIGQINVATLIMAFMGSLSAPFMYSFYKEQIAPKTRKRKRRK